MPLRRRDERPLRDVWERKLEESAGWRDGGVAVNVYERWERARRPSEPYRPPVRYLERLQPAS